MMEPLNLQQVASRVGGELVGSPGLTVRRVTTDSRRVGEGDLFVALRGERFDGHQYAGDALNQGAVAVLGEWGCFPPVVAGRPVVAVENSRIALGRLAAACRQDFLLPVVAVAGSNGKTTVKEVLATLLRERFETLASQASFNNDIGVPLTLLELRKSHRAAVVEAGTNHPGELAALLEVIRPQHGVLTSIGHEHLEFFGDLEGVAAEEGALAEALPAGGRLFVNGDDALIDRVCDRARARAVRVGWSPRCEWRVRHAVVDFAGTWFELRSPAPGYDREFFLPLLGRHQVVNAALALATAAELGLSPEESARGLAACRPAPMRMAASPCGDWTLLEDCYNANTDSMRAALTSLVDLAGDRRSVAVVGPMAEMGDQSAAEHRQVGRAAALSGVNVLVAVGPMAADVACSARASGLSAALECSGTEAALGVLQTILQPGDAVLVKASRAAHFEHLTAGLRRLAVAPGESPGSTGKEAPCCTT
ncbi:MAG: UDP-N-acetylmuramoyl-tripeptide--D-alanyl-D-alanine ligase [Verrucomicrobiales bacterium]|nr:UDP-N-acetylmuramoyl-tripeptide--D-alanyl-D-alanine ligase [Verrucomicrobiales bacterium]